MDWELLFENQLVPMVASARSEAALEKSVGVIMNALFRRADDQASREQFWALLQVSLARAATLEAKIDNAVDFLRLIKTTRKTLAAQSPNKRLESGGVSSDLSAVSITVAPTPVRLTPTPPPPPPRTIPATAPAVAKPAVAPGAAAKTANAEAMANAGANANAGTTANAGATAQAERPPTFAETFDDVVCGYLEQVLGVLRVEQPGALRLPFIAHPAFAAAIDQVARAHVLPAMRDTRHIKTLADSLNIKDGGRKELIRILTAGEINNPILHTWDRRWEDLAPRRRPGKPFKPLPAAKATWTAFARHAEENGYIAPTMDQLDLLLTLPRYDLGRLRAAWREIEQLYHQEFRPGAHQIQAREGALRDALFKWEGREGMPGHALEWLAIKASASFPLLNLAWLDRFSTNKGKTQEERERAIPFLMQVLKENGVTE